MSGDFDGGPGDVLPPVPPGRVERLRGRVQGARARADRVADEYQRRAVERPLLGLPLVFAARYTARQGIMLASACAFRLFLWLMPLALLLAGILAGVSAHHTDSVESAAKQAGITGAVSQQVVTALKGGDRSWWLAVIIGGVSFIWTTRTLMRTLALVNAHSWGVPMPKVRRKDLLVTTVLFALGWLVVFGAVAEVGRVGRELPGGTLLAGVIQAAVLAGAWLAIASRLPDRRTSWLDLLPGSILFGVAFAILHAVSRIYLPNKLRQASQVYGTLGIAATILAWLLIIGQVIVSTALVNVVVTDYLAARRAEPAEQAGPVEEAEPAGQPAPRIIPQ